MAIALKEVADFVQIGLVAWQAGKKFSGSRSFAGGTIGIDGGTARIQVGDVSFTIPVEDVAGAVGVAGAAGRGPAPERSLLAKGGGALRDLLFPAEAVGTFVGGRVARLVGISRDGGAQVAVGAPNPAARPFTLREYVNLQEEAARKGGARKDLRERELAALEQQHKERLAALDAQIEREQVAGRADVTRLEVAGRLLQQREELAARFGLQERDLVAKHSLGAQDQAAEMARLQAKLAADAAGQEAEQAWKTSERVADQRWKAEQKKIADDVGYYYKNAAADRAVSRSIEAAQGIAKVLREVGVSQAAVVSFAQAFSRGVS